MKQLLLLTFLLSSSYALSNNATEGGGGAGGFCQSSHCKTLSQVGLRIEQEQTLSFELSAEVIDEVRKIVELMPVTFDKERLIKRAIAEKKTFVVATKKSKRKYKKFFKEYLDILREHAPDMDLENFELMAISDNSKTYLLRGFLGYTHEETGEHVELDTRGKALTLIHEALVRDYYVSVLNVLKFEGELVKYLKDLESGDNEEYDTWPLILSMRDVGLFPESANWRTDYVLIALLESLRKQNKSLVLGDLCSETDQNSDNIFCDISRERALKLRQLHPWFAEYFSDTKHKLIKISPSNLYQITSQGKSFVKRVCKDNRSSNELQIEVADLDGDGRPGVFAVDCQKEFVEENPFSFLYELPVIRLSN